MRFIPIILMLCCFNMAAVAQPKTGERLLVYSLKGKATFIENKKELPLQIGKVLLPTAVVKFTQGTRMVLVCSQGKALSIAKKGVFSLKPWQDSCRLKMGSVSDQYFRYVWAEMVGPVTRGSGEEPKKAMELNTIGGVARGVLTEQPLEPYVTQLMTARTDINLGWKAGPRDSVFIFFLMNGQGSELYRDTVGMNYMPLSKIAPYLATGENYLWKIARPGGMTGRAASLLFISPEHAGRMRQSIENAVPFPESIAEKQFRMAYMLEQRNLLADAFTYYQQAAEQPGALPLYQQRLKEFRNKYHLE